MKEKSTTKAYNKIFVFIWLSTDIYDQEIKLQLN